MDGMAFFPLTMPFTTGPGTIAVAVALGAERPASGLGPAVVLPRRLHRRRGDRFAGAGCSYRSADFVTAKIGAAARRSVSRMTAFLLLCIGVQIMLTGVEDAAHQFMSGSVAASPAGPRPV